MGLAIVKPFLYEHVTRHSHEKIACADACFKTRINTYACDKAQHNCETHYTCSKNTREELYYSRKIQNTCKTTRELQRVICKTRGNTRECAACKCQV